MSEVIRVTCPHTVVKTFFRDSGIWTTVISEVQMVSDSDSGAFIEHRYPVRCEACGVVADVNQSALNDALDLRWSGRATRQGKTREDKDFPRRVIVM
jgi:hypothetical protein